MSNGPTVPMCGFFDSEKETPWQEVQRLRARLAQLEAVSRVGASIGELAQLAQRYLPAEHHEVALQLLRLAHARGYVEGGCRAAELWAAPVVLMTKEQAEQAEQLRGGR